METSGRLYQSFTKRVMAFLLMTYISVKYSCPMVREIIVLAAWLSRCFTADKFLF
jgi:hypothetical protein